MFTFLVLASKTRKSLLQHLLFTESTYAGLIGYEDDKDEAELHSDDEEWQGLNDITLNAFASAAASLFTSHRAIGEIGEDRIETDEEHGWWEEESENVVGDESLEPPELEVLVGGQWVMWPNGHISACKLMERG